MYWYHHLYHKIVATCNNVGSADRGNNLLDHSCVFNFTEKESSACWHQLLSCLLPSYKGYVLILYMRTFYNFKHKTTPEI